MGTPSKIWILVEIDARSSKRWRSAKSPARATALNFSLSLKRAIQIFNVVDNEIRQTLPNVPVILSGPNAPPSRSSNIPFVLKSVGSSYPTKPIIDPNNNDAQERAGTLIITVLHEYEQLVSKDTTVQQIVKTTHWYMNDIDFDLSDPTHIQIRLTNGLSGKSRRYKANLKGPGTPSLPDARDNPTDTVWDDSPFETGRVCGFKDFEGQHVTVWSGDAGVGIPGTPFGIGVTNTTFSFRDLGGTSGNLLMNVGPIFDSGLKGMKMSGALEPVDPNPGDDMPIIVKRDSPERKIHRLTYHVSVPFDTGQAKLTAEVDKSIRSWTKNTASTINNIIKATPP